MEGLDNKDMLFALGIIAWGDNSLGDVANPMTISMRSLERNSLHICINDCSNRYEV